MLLVTTVKAAVDRLLPTCVYVFDQVKKGECWPFSLCHKFASLSCNPLASFHIKALYTVALFSLYVARIKFLLMNTAPVGLHHEQKHENFQAPRKKLHTCIKVPLTNKNCTPDSCSGILQYRSKVSRQSVASQSSRLET